MISTWAIYAWSVFGMGVFLVWIARSALRWWRSRHHYIYFSGREYELYDTSRIERPQYVTYFQRPVGSMGPDGPQTHAETNLMCNGMLGMPLEMDPESIELYFEDIADPDDITEFLRHSVITFCTGSQTRVFEASGMMFEPVFEFAKEGGVGAMQVLAEADLDRKAARLTRHFTKKVDVQRLTSCDNFHVRVDLQQSKLHGPVTLKVAIKGILWRPGSGPGYGPKVRKEKVPGPPPRYLLAA